MNQNEVTIFAETTFRNQNRKFGIKTDDRRRHMYLIGKTGMGKSTILENMIIEDIRAGRGVAVVDPHGDLAEKVIEFVPNERINDIVYFNPSDMDYPFAFNVVEQVEPHLRHLVASGLLGVFQKLWADSWGPRLEYILRNAILAILDYPGATLLAVMRMLSDKPFRKMVIDKIQDPVVKAFWVNEFAGYADKFASEAVSPIQNKIGQFLSSSLIRNIVGQARSSINIRDVMDEGKVLIMNLSKGRIGEDNSQLLGAMMITKIQLAAMSRVDIPEKERKDFYLYVDEFQNFTSDSFANILSEARKYHLNLIIAHQYIEQLSEKVKPAVFGNVGTMVVFRVGATDSEELVKEFTPVFTEEDIVNLPKYNFYLKLMIDGVASDPFSARGLAPLADSEKTNNVEKIIRVSRERYAKEKSIVEDRINRWSAGDGSDESSAPAALPAPTAGPVAPLPRQFEPPAKKPFLPDRPREERRDPKIFEKRDERRQERRDDRREDRREERRLERPEERRPVAPISNIQAPRSDRPEERRQERPEDRRSVAVPSIQVPRSDRPQNAPARPDPYRHEATCDKCGKQTKTSFPPDGLRPVYCKECLTDLKKDKNGELERRRLAKLAELKAVDDGKEKKDSSWISLKEAMARKNKLYQGGEQRPPKPEAGPVSPDAAEIVPEPPALPKEPDNARIQHDIPASHRPQESGPIPGGEMKEGEEIQF